MLNKRILSFLLAVVLVVGLMPTSVFATENEGEPTPNPVIEPGEGGETPDADGIAPLTEEGDGLDSQTGDGTVIPQTGEGEEGGEGASLCTVCNEPGCEKTHTQCEACGTWDCETEHKYCEKCEKYDCGKAHEVCEICKVEDCGVTHEQCDLCGQYDCDGNDVFCEKCRIWNCGIDHDAACGKCGVPGCTKAHIMCEICQKEDCGVSHVWCETCQKNDCGVDHTVTDPSEETTVPEEEETEPAGPQVGDKIWIKKGAKIYKNLNKDTGWELLGNYEVEIEAIETDEAGNPQWYRFKFTTLGLGEMMLHSYKYVAVADTVEEQPQETTEETTDATACDCEYPPESGNLAEHADSCARKTYIKTLFEGKTAEEIYTEWETYDEATQTDILNMLEVYDNSKFEELNGLVDKEKEDFPEVEIDGALLSITVPEGAFPEGTKSSVEEQNGDDFASAIENVLTELNPDSNILKLIAMDISFECDGEEVQPEIPVTLTFEIAKDDIPSKAESAFVFHITDSGEAELMAEYPKISSDSTLLLDVTANSFSSYVIGFSNQTYDATLLKNALSANSRYSIKEFPVNLFNYDMNSFNNYIDGLTTSNFLKFVTAGDANFQPNNGGAFATQGIVKKSLKNGYPEMTYGFDNGAYIFNTTSYTGKTVAENKNFEFIYDNQTGYYEYNSALNHAQLNGNKVQLYTDTLGPYNFTQQFDMGTVSYRNQVTTSTSNGVLTVNTTGNDPGFGFYSAGYSVSEYSKLYLRLHSDTTETLQVFFNFSAGNHSGYSEGNSIKLTMKEGWNEYYFDYSGLSSGTLYAVRIDVGNTSGKTYKISKMALIRNTANISNMSNAGFYPFENIESSYPNQYKTFNESDWANNLQNETQYTVATRSMYNKYLDDYNVPTDKFHFGMTMEQNFYLPQSRQVNGKDIVFEFSGDDDLWVFIDGKLALDIGGGHTVVSGTINFTTGAVSVSKARQLTSASAATNANAYSGTLVEALRAPGDHTIKIFYLERFSTASNCRIKFNLPVVPTGNVVVEKSVNIENGPSPTEDMIFTFKAEAGGAPLAQETYTVATKDASGNVTSQTNKTTDANGQFTLKHNEAAYFNGIAENTKVKITEITPQNVGSFAYKSTTVNGANGLSAEKTTSANGISSFSFVNTYEVRLADLKITKKGINALDHHEEDGKNKEEKQSTVYTVTGTTADGKTVGPIKVVIVGDDSITIKDLPVGIYTVTEDTNWSWRYGVDGITAKNDATVTVSGASITFDLTYLGEEVTYTNKRDKIYWLSGDSYCENWWNANGNVTRKDS